MYMDAIDIVDMLERKKALEERKKRVDRINEVGRGNSWNEHGCSGLSIQITTGFGATIILSPSNEKDKALIIQLLSKVANSTDKELDKLKQLHNLVNSVTKDITYL